MMAAAWLAIVAFLVPGTGLTGKVRTPDDVPVAGAAVIVQQGDHVFTAITNDRGEFDLPDVVLPAAIEVRASGFASVREQVAASPVTITLSPSVIRESILVQGTAASDDWRRAPTGTTVMTAESLATIPAVTLDEALRTVSGFSLFRRSAARASNPTTHGITMRGLSASGSSRGLVLLDGVPLTDGFGSWVTWTRLPALALDTVEIDRGAQGSTFGSDALGGVLTLSSSLPRQTTAVVRATGGDLGIAAVDVSGGGPRGDSSMFGAMSWFRTDGVIPTAPESAGPIDVPADAEWLSALGKARFGSAVDQITLSAVGQHGRSRQRHASSTESHVGRHPGSLVRSAARGDHHRRQGIVQSERVPADVHDCRGEPQDRDIHLDAVRQHRRQPARRRSGARRAARVHDGTVRPDANGRGFYRASHIVIDPDGSPRRLGCRVGAWGLVVDRRTVTRGGRPAGMAGGAQGLRGARRRDGRKRDGLVAPVAERRRSRRRIEQSSVADAERIGPEFPGRRRAHASKSEPAAGARGLRRWGGGRVRPQLARVGRRILDGRRGRNRERHDSEHTHDHS